MDVVDPSSMVPVPRDGQPKTANGKSQKFKLREKGWQGRAPRMN